ncbi:MAG: aminotransferase IV [Candidatus Yanofskybacteria bacterium CG10_big_fil_rev_8_21_14_0_10_46_23]|uniref:Aminotransferase IV n=1 Tax=Candidatus Yanofskybacteria bacterium CG10_big_fil_rev_8_21_14_0_10_46_23 TaxID=1975098 RepID=A0A2H0R6I2_9BACT|nr:MAG: aminotransferase IV [Candidatus Yanofskybacteria bacterium CG10_big_fil_rev_8_21_14_0_10_46_23]
MNKLICFLNGQFLPITEAKISVQDLGLSRAFGVFDSIRLYRGQPLHLEDHLNRFRESANVINLELPDNFEEMPAVIKALFEKNNANFKTDAFVKIILTGGPSPDSFSYSRDHSTLMALMFGLSDNLAIEQTEGVKAITQEYKRIFPEAKTLNYTVRFALQDKIKSAGAKELVYIHDGKILEGSMSNFFLIKDNLLVTPDSGILKGVTRKVALHLAQEANFEIQERPVLLSELASAQEAFITSTAREITPLVQLDETVIGGGQPGVKTKQLIETFKRYVQDYSPPAL